MPGRVLLLQRVETPRRVQTPKLGVCTMTKLGVSTTIKKENYE